VALLLSLWVHAVLYSGEFLTKTTTAPSQEAVEGRSWYFLKRIRSWELTHRRLCRVKNMLAMYLKYHKARLTPTTSVTSTAISSVKMVIGHKSLTNLRSEMIFLQGKPVFISSYSTESDIPWLISPRDIIFNPLDISSRTSTHCDRPKKDHKTRWWGLNFMALGHLCADWYFTAN
jgi:hypothetical protein